MGAVVGNYRRLGFRICILDSADLFLGHIHGAEHEVHLCRYLFHFIYIHNRQLFHGLRHGSCHLPAVSNRILIGSSCTSRARSHSRHLKPWMIFQKRDKALSYHSRRAKNTYL